MRITKKLTIRNKMGLHTRPATFIVKSLQSCKSEVFFTHGRKTINAKSVLAILTLAATRNSKVMITIEGEDAAEVMETLVAAFENQFGESL